MPKHVAVLMGGWSSERPVSLSSGRECADALERLGYRVTRIDADRAIAATLAGLKPDVVFNALHGPYGEDGRIQGILDVLAIPYTHSGVLASALAMDKPRTKAVLAAAGIPVAEHRLASRSQIAAGHVLPPPYVVKPPCEGSSFGVIIVKADQPHPPQEVLRADWPYGEELMVEKYIPGRELTCAATDDRVFDIIEIVPQGFAFYDYDSKYRPGGSTHILPAKLKPNIYHHVQNMTRKAHHALGCRGISRSDFRFADDGTGAGEVICLEVNTQPGMTPTSLVPDMARHAGMSFEDLIGWIVEDASCDR